MRSIILSVFIILSTLTSAQSEFYDNKQLLCIAQNIYWEARNQPFRGMVAVGQVTMNRVKDKRFPDTPCEVVEQGPTKPSWIQSGTDVSSVGTVTANQMKFQRLMQTFGIMF